MSETVLVGSQLRILPVLKQSAVGYRMRPRSFTASLPQPVPRWPLQPVFFSWLLQPVLRWPLQPVFFGWLLSLAYSSLPAALLHPFCRLEGSDIEARHRTAQVFGKLGDERVVFIVDRRFHNRLGELGRTF